MGLLDDFFATDQETRTTSGVEPWSPIRGELERLADLLGRAAKTPLEMFPGQMYAPQTEAERMQIQSLMDMANQFSSLIMPSLGMALGAPDIANNPYVQGMAESIQSQVNRNLMENILPQLTANEIAGGGFGTRGAVAEGVAARGTQDVLAENLANLYGGAYQTGMGAMMQGLSMAPGLMMAPSTMLGQAGALERGEAQRAIDEERMRFEFEQMEPWQRAQMGLSMAAPLGSMFSTGTSTSSGQSIPSPFQQMAGIGMLGSGILGGIGSMDFWGPSGIAGSRIGSNYNPYMANMGPWGHFPYWGM